MWSLQYLKQVCPASAWNNFHGTWPQLLRVISLQPSTNQILKALGPSVFQHFVIFCHYWTAGERQGASSKQLILSVKDNEVLTDFLSSDHPEYQNDKTEMKYDKIKMLLMQLGQKHYHYC